MRSGPGAWKRQSMLKIQNAVRNSVIRRQCNARQRFFVPTEEGPWITPVAALLE